MALLPTPVVAEEDEKDSQEGPLGDAEAADVDELRTVLESDVFAHFELDEEYSTPLQRKLFKRSAEYKEKAAELAKARRDALGKTYSIDLAGEMAGIDQYDLKRKVLRVNVGTNSGWGITATEVRAPRSVGGVLLVGFSFGHSAASSIPGEKIEFLALPMPEAKAAAIEKAKGARVVILFKPRGVKKLPVRFFNSADGSWYRVRVKVVIARQSRVVIMGSEDAVLFDSGWKGR